MRYRNIDGLTLNKTERAFIYETIKRPLPLGQRINIICATGTIKGALINDLVVNETVTFEEYSNHNNGISFYQSNC